MGILREKFAHLNLVYSIGGQISFDIFPQVNCHACPNAMSVMLASSPYHLYSTCKYSGGRRLFSKMQTVRKQP